MARIVGYIASSLDGFIADENEGLEWLYAAEAELGEHHYDEFIKGIRTIVMGRSTYDWLVRSGMAWAYGEQRVLVVTSRPIDDPIGPLETRSDIDALIAELRGLSDGDVWMLGGGKLQMAFIETGRARRDRDLCGVRDYWRWVSAVPDNGTQGDAQTAIGQEPRAGDGTAALRFRTQVSEHGGTTR